MQQEPLFEVGEHGDTKDDRFTPSYIIHLVRVVFSDIGLDPASCAEANNVVRALNYFTIEDDGLQQEWNARFIFCNPPYSTIDDWVDKAMNEFHFGRAENIIFICNAFTETNYCQRLLKWPVCFPAKRIPFWHPTIKLESPRYASMITCISRSAKLISCFDLVFREIGVVKR